MSPEVKQAERAYTIAEVAGLKGVSPDYVRAAIRATEGNTLAAKKVGRGYRISASAVESWWAGLADA
ncbi:MAG: excisionase family DNA-binding protein [Marmoricola sp.]